MGPGWERAFLLLPARRGSVWGGLVRRWGGRHVPSSLRRIQAELGCPGREGWPRGLLREPCPSSKAWSLGKAPPPQDGAGSPVLTGKCWKCLQEAFHLSLDTVHVIAVGLSAVP